MECLVSLCKNNVIHQSNEKEASDCTYEHNDRKEKKLTIIITRHTNYGINNQISDMPVCMIAK